MLSAMDRSQCFSTMAKTSSTEQPDSSGSATMHPANLISRSCTLTHPCRIFSRGRKTTKPAMSSSPPGSTTTPKIKAPVFILSIVAGRLLTVPASAPTPDQTCNFSSDLPLHQGDSGGPLVDTNGRLLGINGVVKYNFLKSLGLPGKLTCYAIRPDTVWLDQLIETDFASQRSATPDSTRKARD